MASDSGRQISAMTLWIPLSCQILGWQFSGLWWHPHFSDEPEKSHYFHFIQLFLVTARVITFNLFTGWSWNWKSTSQFWTRKNLNKKKKVYQWYQWKPKRSIDEFFHYLTNGETYIVMSGWWSLYESDLVLIYFICQPKSDDTNDNYCKNETYMSKTLAVLFQDAKTRGCNSEKCIIFTKKLNAILLTS